MKSIVDVIHEAMKMQSFMPIDAMVKAVRDCDDLDPTEWDAVTEPALALYLRRVMRSKKGEDGFPEYGNVSIEDEEGKKTQGYKQEKLFDVDDYKQVAGYHFDAMHFHFTKGLIWRKRLKERYGIQMPIPFEKLPADDDEDIDDADGSS